MFLFLFKFCFTITCEQSKFNFLFFVSPLRPPPPLARLSESSDISDPLEELPRFNCDTALEAIDGVQPELQNTLKDSEIYSKFYLFF